ncbi:unnamed protein product [Trichobilharzia szidati]|nr:unnamed protein product [Trichobilharzia szidati]
MSQSQSTDTNRETPPFSSDAQSIIPRFEAIDSIGGGGVYTPVTEEQTKCNDSVSNQYFEQDTTTAELIASTPTPPTNTATPTTTQESFIITSPLSSPPTIEPPQLPKICAIERLSDPNIPPAHSSPSTTIGLSPSQSLSVDSQFTCVTTINTSSSNPTTNVSPITTTTNTTTITTTTTTPTTTTTTTVRRPRHKPAERRELLELAVNDVLGSQISMRRAAQKYNLAKSSLCDYVRKNGIILPNLRFKSYHHQTLAGSTGSAGNTASTDSSRKGNLLPGTNSSRQTSTSSSCKRTGSPVDEQTNAASITTSLPAKLSCGINRKVNIGRTRNLDNHPHHPHHPHHNKQQTKLSGRGMNHVENLSFPPLDNIRGVSSASTCDMNCIRSLISCDRIGTESSCSSDLCLSSLNQQRFWSKYYASKQFI